MRIDNTPEQWGWMARALHWLVAGLVFVQLFLGWAAEREHDRERSFALIRDHYQFGVVLFGVMLMRALWRLSQSAPRPPDSEPRWRRLTAHGVHAMLYCLLITMPISGYIIWVHMHAPMEVFGLFTLPTVFTPPVEDETLRAGAWYVHYASGWFVVGLVALHIAAALWHLLAKDDGVFKRMVG